MSTSTNPTPEPTSRTRVDIPALTFLKITVALAMIYATIHLAPLLLLFALAMLIAGAFYPLIVKLEEKNIPRWVAITGVAFLLIGSLCGIVFGLLPQIVEQVGSVGKNLPELQKSIETAIPWDWLRRPTHQMMQNPKQLFGEMPQYLASLGAFALGGISSIGILLVLSIYLMVDGPTAYRWLVAFFAPETQQKIHRTADEVSVVVSAYVLGQIITSVIAAVFTFAVCEFMNIPGSLALAALAAVFDALPIVGIIALTLCLALMALSVSGETALIACVLFLIYHAVETYFIIPKVYGSRLRLSTLAVLLSFLFAGALGGVIAALMILPIVASYPIVEKIWLKRYLGEKTVSEHRKQEAEA